MHSLARRLSIASTTVVPISALHGDNVVERSTAAPWYDGPTVLDALESASAGGWASQHGLRQGNGGRLPVQSVLRQPGGGVTEFLLGASGQGDRCAVSSEKPGGPKADTAATTDHDGPLPIQNLLHCTPVSSITR